MSLPLKIRIIHFQEMRELRADLVQFLGKLDLLVSNLDPPLQDLDLPMRVYYALNEEGINTLGDLCAKTEKELLMIRGIGPYLLEKTKEELTQVGVSLRQEVEEVELWEDLEGEDEEKLL